MSPFFVLRAVCPGPKLLTCRCVLGTPVSVRELERLPVKEGVNFFFFFFNKRVLLLRVRPVFKTDSSAARPGSAPTVPGVPRGTVVSAYPWSSGSSREGQVEVGPRRRAQERLEASPSSVAQGPAGGSGWGPRAKRERAAGFGSVQKEVRPRGVGPGPLPVKSAGRRWMAGVAS